MGLSLGCRSRLGPRLPPPVPKLIAPLRYDGDEDMVKLPLNVVRLRLLKAYGRQDVIRLARREDVLKVVVLVVAAVMGRGMG